MADTDPTRVDEFVRLLAQNQRRLFIYVHTLVPHHADAEEVLQNTNLVLWREFGTFQPGTNFAAWSCRVALNQVLAWRKKRQRDRLQFSDEFLTTVADEVQSTGARWRNRPGHGRVPREAPARATRIDPIAVHRRRQHRGDRSGGSAHR